MSRYRSMMILAATLSVSGNPINVPISVRARKRGWTGSERRNGVAEETQNNIFMAAAVKRTRKALVRIRNVRRMIKGEQRAKYLLAGHRFINEF